ncbi:hypothetical protein V2J09_006434 [Rumex salicifolius]
MTWCNDSSNDVVVEKISSSSPSPSRNNNSNNNPNNNNGGGGSALKLGEESSFIRKCPSCGHQISINVEDQGRRINELPGLPAGVRFDPTDQEILLHLEGKVKAESRHRLHPLIDDFIPTLEGENGICYTHPEKLPGVNKDGQVRHFFHRPSKAYTTGTRKRRKVHTDDDGSETRWHKTGKTRPVVSSARDVRGYKKILVLYTNYGKQKKPQKTSWVMHQYHLGLDEDEKEGELVVSKVFYQTQPRHCAASPSAPGSAISLKLNTTHHHSKQNDAVQYPSSIISFEHHHHHHSSSSSGRPTSSSAAIFPFCCP